MKVHFMGIGGSGMSAASAIAKAYGYDVDGCDININTPYTEKLNKEIHLIHGHSIDHLEDKDLLVVSPAVYFGDPKPKEFEKARNKLTWQEFTGKYLQGNKEVISIAGTHGKSTTTAMLSLVFEAAGLSPTVLLGAKVPQWGENFKIGTSDKFIVEADEFFNSFLNYKPDAIILNNIEFDHPDFFKTKSQLLTSFKKHLQSLVGKSILIVNKDSEEAYNLAKNIPNLNLYTYSIKDKSADFYGEIIKRTDKFTEFKLICKRLKINESFRLSILGDFNVSNALGVIALSCLYSIKLQVIKIVLKSFQGIGRRLELLGEKDGIKIYDDYAHHPTAIKETLKALRQKYKNNRIIAIVEPHSYSRTKSLLTKYKNAFTDADRVIIAPIFKARDKEDFGISEDSIVKASQHNSISSVKTFQKTLSVLNKVKKKGDIIIVMGAGKSYEISRKLLS